MPVIDAILPIFLIIGLGKALTCLPLIRASAWDAIERIVLYILFPALIINVLASADFGAGTLPLIGALVMAQIIMAALGLAARRPGAGPSTASIIQSNVRFNTFVGLSIVSAFLGDPGLALFIVAAAGMIPTANLISISAFAGLSDTPLANRQRVLSIVLNPLIVACLIGGGLNVLNAPVPAALGQTLDLLAQAAIALGLLCAGAAIDFTSLNENRVRVAVWSLIRLVGFPLLVYVIARALDLSDMARAVAIIAAATPTSTSGVILASQLNGDKVLATNLVAAQTLLCIVTVPVLLFCLVG